MAPATSTILFAGGGTGGHIFPGLAVWERLVEQGASRQGRQALFVVSNRPLDAQILSRQPVIYAATSAQPLTMKPWQWPAFWQAWSNSVAEVGTLIQKMNVRAVVAMGGFVSGPACAAARAAGIPVALVNLDAVPGKANRWMAQKARTIFSVYPSPRLPGATPIGLPLRRSALGPADKNVARQQMGLAPEKETLFITAGSQGASTLNRMMVELARNSQLRRALADWQILHLTGDKDQAEVGKAYAEAGLAAKVLPFCDTMGLAWASATIAISRAGANSVAEVWANAVPTIFFPYPFHKDQHQKLNAEPLTRAGMSLLMLDQIAPEANARELSPRLLALMSNATQRYQMAEQMRHTTPADGAEVIARWALGIANK